MVDRDSRLPLRASRHRSGPLGRRIRAALVLALVLTTLTVTPNPAQAQLNAIVLGVGPAFPAQVTVGDQNQPGLLAVTNLSIGNLSTQPVTLTSIRLNPTCDTSAATVPEPCPDFEERPLPGPIFNIDPIAVGRAGTACAGILFAVSPPNAVGTVTLTPSAPVVLGPSAVGGPQATCLVDFTFDVLQRPIDGETNAVAVVEGSAPAPPPAAPGTIVGPVPVTGASSVIVVAAAPPAIRTQAAPQTVTEGGSFADTATVTGVPGGPPLTGSVLFTLYRSAPANPGFPTCALGEAVASGTVQVQPGPAAPNGAPTATATFTPPAQPVGRYVFVATYNPPGGANPDVNYGTVTSACGDPAEQVTVNSLLPSLVVEKSANPTQVNEPGGPVVFSVRVINTGPNALTLTSLTDNVYGNLAGQGTCTVAPPGSRPPTPPLLAASGGEYTCSFTAPVPPLGSPPGQAGQAFTDVVTAVGTDTNGNTATANDDAVVTVVGVPPSVAVTKTPSPQTLPEPGGTFTYTVVVTNTSTVEPITLTSLTDSVYGNLFTRPGSTCAALNGTILPVALGPGNTATCTFTGDFIGPPGSLTDVVTVTGQDNEGQTATANDDAVVTITPIPPAVDVVKTASPLSRPEPGGDFTYTVVVTNTSRVEPLTITSLVDNVYGPLQTRGTCTTAIGTTLAVAPGPGNTYTCTFTAPFNGPGGSSLTDVVTVVGQDNDGQTATDNDDAVVTITDVPPAVRVVKTAAPTSLPAPGGTFTFTAVVTNPSTETITITRLTDDIYGDLATRPGSTCGALIGTILAPGASSAPCTFTGVFNGAPGASQTDIVTVTARDDEGNVVTDTDDATVTITGAPAIRVDKTADPSSRPEPGGDFTYTVVVTNVGPEPLTITSLNDNVYGNLAARPGSTCGTLIGTVLAPGASSAPCTFTAPFTGSAGASLTDIVTVVGTSANGTQVNDTDDAVVTLTPVPPTIAVDKTADPLTRPVPGGDFTFRVVVTNTSASEAVTITSLSDNIYGNIAVRPGSTCGALIGTVLAPGASSAPCTFTGPFTGVAGQSQTDIVTATGVDDDGQTATANDDATVTLIGVTPAIRVDKRATPPTRPAPGGTFTFDVLVTNTGPNSLTITTLTDDVYGSLATRGTCTTAVGTVLPSGGSYACSFQGDFIGIGGAAQTDIVTVTGTDAAGNVVNDSDDATVTLTNVAPTVRVVKTASPLTLPEPGGAFTFTAVVTNTSAERVRITSLTDDIYGNLATRANSTCGALIGTFLAAGASSAPCSFQGNFFGDAGASQTDIVTVVVTDDEGTTATDSDDAVVDITDIPPSINVVKDAMPASLPAPGGTFTFTVMVTNNSFEPVTIRSLTDDVYGSLVGRGTCNVGAVLAPNGGTYSCSFPGDFTGPPNASQTDTVTVVGVDNDNTTVTDTDDAIVRITGVPATLTTQVSAGSVGSEVFDTATLAGGFSPTGTITFRLFGPNDDACARSPIFTSVKPVTGTTDPRIIVSDRFVLPSPGVYRFVATYSGDVNNPQITTACLDPAETIGVGRLPLNFSTQASPMVGLGGAIFDTATIGGGFNPTGSVTFNVYGPDNANCTGTPAFTSVRPVSGTGTTPVVVTSESFVPTLPGTYRFVASYSGDANNASAVSPCNDPLEQVVVTPLPVIQVEKTAVPDSLPTPGGSVTFRVVVTNTSNVPLTIRSLNDNVYGNITTLAGSTCNTAIGTVLAPAPGPNNTYSCQFVGDVRGAVGSVHTDIVTVTATDTRGNTVRDDDDAVVRITGVIPTIVTTKVASPTSLPEPGGTFSFVYTVTNTGPDPVTITSLIDNVYGDLNGRGTCAIGARLAGSGGTYTCTFSGNFFGNAGAAQTDIISTTARNDQGQTVTSRSQATVRITDVPPTIRITKSADPVSRPEPGGSFRFTVTVTNTSFEPVTTTSLVDDIYGDLNGRGSCGIGVRLAANGGAYSCAFDGEFRGAAGVSQTDTVTAIAVDDDNTPATDRAKATVTITPAGTPPVSQPPGTPPVSQPPGTPPQPGTPPVSPPPPTPPVQPPLVRTGSDLAGPARLAGLLLLIGMTLVAATRRFGDGGPGLASVPAGPRTGPGGGGFGGGAGPWFGKGNWFRGTRVRPSRGPLGGAGLAAGLVAMPEIESRREAPVDRVTVTEPDWDEWVSSRAQPAGQTRPDDGPVEAWAPGPVGLQAAEPERVVEQAVVAEPLIPELDRPEVVPEVPAADVAEVAPVAVPEVFEAKVSEPEPVGVVHAPAAEVVVPDAVLPAVVGNRSNGALDGAALDAAQALSVPARVQAPPAGRRRGGKPGRR